MKYVVWIVVAFALYSGWVFLGANSARSNIAYTVEGVLKGVHHYTDDEVIKTRIVRNAKVTSIELAMDEIFVQRETREGARIVTVAVQHPITVGYLGSERTVWDDVSVSHTFAVDETVETRRLDGIQQQDDAKRRNRARADRFNSKVHDVWLECEAKFGKGNCEMTKPPAGTRDGEVIKGWEN